MAYHATTRVQSLVHSPVKTVTNDRDELQSPAGLDSPPCELDVVLTDCADFDGRDRTPDMSPIGSANPTGSERRM